MAVFYDTHAHLDYPDFAAEVPEVIARAQAAGITKIISIGTDVASSQRAIDLASRFENVYAVVGWHPSDAMEAPEDFAPVLRELAKQPKVVAIGETGLDYYRLPSTRKQPGTLEDDAVYKARQAALFRQHLEVARELGLNVVIHQRDNGPQCFEDTLSVLAPFAQAVRGVFHCFGGGPAEVERVLALRSMVSFTGILTFKNAANVRDALAAVPTGEFMLETDSPFLAPMPYRGKRCEPAYVREIAIVAAQVKHCTLEDLSEVTCAAAHMFFPGLLK